MVEIKYDIKRGAEIYKTVYDGRLKRWISKGTIKRGEVLVWRSGLSGWRKPEDLEELKPYFDRWEKSQLRKVGKKGPEEQIIPLTKKIKKILIIDDEKDLCMLLADVLSRRGYKVVTVHTKRKALAYLKRKVPDLVFLDLKLPDGDGIKILAKIKKLSPEMIVNIITAYGSEERREEARELGAYNFIDKPFTEEDVLRSIE